jgi:hypothetical protein
VGRGVSFLAALFALAGPYPEDCFEKFFISFLAFDARGLPRRSSFHLDLKMELRSITRPLPGDMGEKSTIRCTQMENGGGASPCRFLLTNLFLSDTVFQIQNSVLYAEYGKTNNRSGETRIVGLAIYDFRFPVHARIKCEEEA